MKITVTSVFVDDQEKALKFYTEILGFVKKNDIPLGEARWLTVTAPDSLDGIELLLEPDWNPAISPTAAEFKRGLYNAGIPFTMFAVDDIQQEYERLGGLGVSFTLEPTPAGPVTIAVFDDTCGNLIQIAQHQASNS
jgi:catechol 2,3-dioxygenase-like lactoylglutathione lyase family enzyme